MNSKLPSNFLKQGLKYFVLLPCWAAAIFGTLQMHDMDFKFGHAICGRWGCGPAVEALLGFHGFSLLLIVPGVMLVGKVISDERRVGLSRLLIWGGCVAALVYMVADGITFYRQMGSLEYSWQRALFSIAVAVDRPFLQVILAGWCLRIPFTDGIKVILRLGFW